MLILLYKALSLHAHTQKISLDLCSESVLIQFSSHEDAAMRSHCWHSSLGKQLWT